MLKKTGLSIIWEFAQSSNINTSPLVQQEAPSLLPASRVVRRAVGAQRSLVLPDGGQDGPGSATDVMPAFARGHLGEADGSMSTPSAAITTAGSLLNPPQGVRAGSHTACYMLST